MGTMKSHKAGVDLRSQVKSTRGTAASTVVCQTKSSMGARTSGLPVSGVQMPGKGRSNTNTRNSSSVQDQASRNGGAVPRGARRDPPSGGGAVIGRGLSDVQTANSSSVVRSGARRATSGGKSERSAG